MSESKELEMARRDLMSAAEAMNDAERQLLKTRWEFEAAQKKVLELERKEQLQ